MALRDRLRPWHGLLTLTFLLGSGVSLARVGRPAPNDVLLAVVSGLFAAAVLQFTVGNVWGYAVAYTDAGGSWTDLPFLSPFVVAALVLLAVVILSPGGLTVTVLATALWSAFWGFVGTAAVVAVVVWVASGYRTGRS